MDRDGPPVATKDLRKRASSSAFAAISSGSRSALYSPGIAFSQFSVPKQVVGGAARGFRRPRRIFLQYLALPLRAREHERVANVPVVDELRHREQAVGGPGWPAAKTRSPSLSAVFAHLRKCGNLIDSPFRKRAPAKNRDRSEERRSCPDLRRRTRGSPRARRPGEHRSRSCSDRGGRPRRGTASPFRIAIRSSPCTWLPVQRSRHCARPWPARHRWTSSRRVHSRVTSSVDSRRRNSSPGARPFLGPRPRVKAILDKVIAPAR